MCILYWNQKLKSSRKDLEEQNHKMVCTLKKTGLNKFQNVSEKDSL